MSTVNGIEVAVEELVGNRLGAGVYRRWVERIGLRGDERVLEIGTGAGACARHLAEALPRGLLTCVEIDREWLRIAEKRLSPFSPRVECVIGDATTWCRPGAFDVAVAHFVLHDVPPSSLRAIVRNVAASLRHRGRFWIREPLGHGMGLGALRDALASAGFELLDAERHERVPLMGESVTACWLRR